MAAATVSNKKTLYTTPFIVREFKLSSMTSDQQETITHGEEGMTVTRLSTVIETPPTSREPMDIQLVSQSVANRTVTIRPYGGDLTGAVIRVQFEFRDAAEQDRDSLDQFT